jgi:hypothetical protein
MRQSIRPQTFGSVLRQVRCAKFLSKSATCPKRTPILLRVLRQPRIENNQIRFMFPRLNQSSSTCRRQKSVVVIRPRHMRVHLPHVWVVVHSKNLFYLFCSTLNEVSSFPTR